VEYKGSVYVAVVGSVQENGICRDSIEGITLREKDARPHYIRATKGYEARQMHLNNWYENTKHPFILFLDSDMIFPQNTLERLRAHKAPFVSGFYMRRTIQPVCPVWFERNEPGVMPMRPMTALLEKNKTYPIGASGWGCILVHRDVITAMKPLLKGEPEVLEDDMDVYPYDLQEVLAGREQLKPLRGVKDTVGSDIRFPFFANLAGFPLLGDTGVCPQHMTDYGITIDDWLGQPASAIRDLSLYINQENRKEIEKLRKATA
jgi:glycosyltransferase involved in cell wall biosynthesis